MFFKLKLQHIQIWSDFLKCIAHVQDLRQVYFSGQQSPVLGGIALQSSPSFSNGLPQSCTAQTIWKKRIFKMCPNFRICFIFPLMSYLSSHAVAVFTRSFSWCWNLWTIVVEISISVASSRWWRCSGKDAGNCRRNQSRDGCGLNARWNVALVTNRAADAMLKNGLTSFHVQNTLLHYTSSSVSDAVAEFTGFLHICRHLSSIRVELSVDVTATMRWQGHGRRFQGPHSCSRHNGDRRYETHWN